MRFDHYIPTRILFGRGQLKKLHEHKLPGTKALIVTTAGQSVKKYGYLQQVEEQLKMSGVSVTLFDKILPNPILEHVHKGAKLAKDTGCDFVVGLGGGSAIDSSKAIAVMATNPGVFWDYVSGGSGKGIATALEPDGVRRLRDFVAAGGGYVGVCAGAYLAAYGLTEYTGMMPLHHSQPWAKGGATLKFSLTPAGEALLGKEFARFETKYNNGPVFTDLANADVTPLATFESPSTDSKGVVRQEMVGTPAIMSMTWHKGRIITISPHPEGRPPLYALVARAIAWTIGADPATVKSADAASPPAG